MKFYPINSKRPLTFHDQRVASGRPLRAGGKTARTIVDSRLLSVVTWSHQSFVAIGAAVAASLAAVMVSMTLGIEWNLPLAGAACAVLPLVTRRFATGPMAAADTHGKETPRHRPESGDAGAAGGA